MRLTERRIGIGMAALMLLPLNSCGNGSSTSETSANQDKAIVNTLKKSKEGDIVTLTKPIIGSVMRYNFGGEPYYSVTIRARGNRVASAAPATCIFNALTDADMMGKFLNKKSQVNERIDALTVKVNQPITEDRSIADLRPKSLVINSKITSC